LGESRPQELWEKAAALAASGGIRPGTPVRWHLVGHLQRNKIHRTLPLVHLVHSVDSRRLIEAIHDEATSLARPINVLLEANISGDITKTGFPPEELAPILADAAQWPHVSIRGLMGMASLVGGTETALRDFERLRALRDRLSKSAPAGTSLDELSMGMSGDFEVAIQAGATIVRVGSALFEGIHT
jgi:pyridoxal phosphate enzyme (YggS family)